MKVLLFVLVALLLSVPAFAKPCGGLFGDVTGNPDERASVLFLVGGGTLEADESEADVESFGATLTIPAARFLSLVATWQKSETDWGILPRCSPLRDTTGRTYSLGVRLYLP